MNAPLLRRYGSMEVVPQPNGSITIAVPHAERPIAMSVVLDQLPHIVDLVAQAEVEGRHAVDALMRVSEARRMGGEHA